MCIFLCILHGIGLFFIGQIFSIYAMESKIECLKATLSDKSALVKFYSSIPNDMLCQLIYDKSRLNELLDKKLTVGGTFIAKSNKEIIAVLDLDVVENDLAAKDVLHGVIGSNDGKKNVQKQREGYPKYYTFHLNELDRVLPIHLNEKKSDEPRIFIEDDKIYEAIASGNEKCVYLLHGYAYVNPLHRGQGIYSTLLCYAFDTIAKIHIYEKYLNAKYIALLYVDDGKKNSELLFRDFASFIAAFSSPKEVSIAHLAYNVSRPLISCHDSTGKYLFKRNKNKTWTGNIIFGILCPNIDVCDDIQKIEDSHVVDKECTIF